MVPTTRTRVQDIDKHYQPMYLVYTLHASEWLEQKHSQATEYWILIQHVSHIITFLFKIIILHMATN